MVSDQEILNLSFEIMANKNLKANEEYKIIKDKLSRLNKLKKDDLITLETDLTLSEYKKINKEKLDNKIQELSLIEKSKLDVQLNTEDFTELELMGFFISTHPLKLFMKYDKYFDYIPLNILLNEEDETENETDDNETKENINTYLDEEIQTIGMISNIKEITTKTDKKMAFIDIEHLGTSLSISLAPFLWPKFKNKIN